MSDLLNSASLVMIPSGYKEDVVYSQIPTDGSADLSFTRASNGTRINSAGLVEVCPWNYILNSNATWTATNVTVTSGVTDANGGTNAYNISGIATGNVTDYADKTTNPMSIIANNSITFSIYMKGSGTIATYIERSVSGTYFFDTKIHTLSSEWQRFTHTYTPTTDAGGVSVYVGNLTGTTATSVDICFTQLNIGSTAKPYFPTTDRLNVPRLTYQNGGGGCPSLLLEKQSTNYLKYSNDFTQSVWSASGSITRTANYAVSPDGTQTATRIQWNGTDGELYQYLGQTTPTRSSVYVKGTAGQVINFCLNLITLTGEWQRIEAASLIDGSDTWFGIITKSSVGHTATDFLLWGGQGENGTYATSLIYTTSSSATRVADACYKTGISSLIGQTEGVLFAEFDMISNANSGAYQTIINIATDANNSIDILKNNTTSELYVFAINGGVIQVNSVGISGTNILGRHKIALAYKSNDYVCYLDGVQVFTDTSASVPACSNLYLGAYLGASNILAGSIYQAVIFKTRLTNAELASLTTI